ARRDDPADHDRHLPRGVPPDPGAPRGGGARARRDPLGDDPDGGAPLRPRRHRVGGDARPRPRPRRDDGRHDGALRLGRRHLRAAHRNQPDHHPGEHRAAVPGGLRRGGQRAHRDGARALRGAVRGERDRPVPRQPPRRLLGSQLMSAVSPPIANTLSAGRLPKATPWLVLGASWAVMAVVFALLNASSGGTLDDFNIAAAIFLGTALYAIAIFVVSWLVEGTRKAKDRLVTALVATAFVVALLPLVSLLYTVVVAGIQRFDLEFFTYSMRNIVGVGGGAVHAIWGTLLITLAATVI